MIVPNRACSWITLASWVLACLLPWASPSRGGEFRLDSVGARVGSSFNYDGYDFTETKAFLNWRLPWGWNLGKEWHLQSRLDVAAGWLGSSAHDAAIGEVGPSLVLGRKGLPLSLEGGVNPTFLSKHEFGRQDFGADVQFTSHIGLNWDFAQHWRVGYRFQHMSNAGFASPNPGLNMHVLSLSFLF